VPDAVAPGAPGRLAVPEATPAVAAGAPAAPDAFAPGAAFAVEGSPVAVGGTGVALGGTRVAVGGTGVAVAGTCVGVGGGGVGLGAGRVVATAVAVGEAARARPGEPITSAAASARQAASTRCIRAAGLADRANLSWSRAFG